MVTVNSRLQKFLLLTGKFPSPKKVEFRLDEIAVKGTSLIFLFSCAKLSSALMHNGGAEVETQPLGALTHLKNRAKVNQQIEQFPAVFLCFVERSVRLSDR